MKYIAKYKFMGGVAEYFNQLIDQVFGLGGKYFSLKNCGNSDFVYHVSCVSSDELGFQNSGFGFWK